MSKSTPETITIPLTKGYVAIVDLCDADLATLKWTAQIGGMTAYAYRQIRKPDGKLGKEYLHRVILARILARPLQHGEEVDHIDRDGLKNSRANLRLANRSTNTANTRPRRTNKSGYKGVSWDKRRMKWCAEVMQDYRRVYIGYFDDAKTAHDAYVEAAKRHFGEFAYDGK